MNRRRINLLPEQRLASRQRDVAVRLGVVACVLVVALTVIGALLLIPTQLLLAQMLEVKQSELATLEANHTTSDQASVSGRLHTLLNNVAAVTALKNSSSMSGTLQKILAMPHAGITIFNMSYTLGTPPTLLISGTAATRDDLHNYQAAMQAASFIHTSSLPVSSYAKDVLVPFTITVTLAP